MPNTSGLLHRVGTVIDEDATAVKRLRDAGVIILGVTNVSELCMWYETSNKVLQLSSPQSDHLLFDNREYSLV